MLIALLPVSAIAAESTGVIDVIHATTNDAVDPLQRNMLFVKLKGGFTGGCLWLTVAPDNAYFASALLSAEARGKSVTLYYNDAAPAPGGLCIVNTLRIDNT